MITLNKRMKTITDMAERVSVIADVGCDHGKLGTALLLQDKADKVLFCDISAPSLEKARILTENQGLSDRAEFFCRDGLGDIKCDTAIIAGMGGMEILSIIENAVTLPGTLILQPMKDSTVLRQRLSDRYCFEKDFLIYGGDKYYDMMKLRRGCDSFTELQLAFGKDNVTERSDDFLRYLEKEYALTRRVLSVTENDGIRRRERLIKELL